MAQEKDKVVWQDLFSWHETRTNKGSCCLEDKFQKFYDISEPRRKVFEESKCIEKPFSKCYKLNNNDRKS